MDDYVVKKRWKTFVETTEFRGERQDVYDNYEWRDYRKDGEWGRYQVWKNNRRSGFYTPPVGVLLRQLEALNP